MNARRSPRGRMHTAMGTFHESPGPFTLAGGCTAAAEVALDSHALDSPGDQAGRAHVTWHEHPGQTGRDLDTAESAPVVDVDPRSDKGRQVETAGRRTLVSQARDCQSRPQLSAFHFPLRRNCDLGDAGAMRGILRLSDRDVAVTDDTVFLAVRGSEPGTVFYSTRIATERQPVRNPRIEPA